MRFLAVLATLAAAASAAAQTSPHVKSKQFKEARYQAMAEMREMREMREKRMKERRNEEVVKRSDYQYLTNTSEPFLVNGTNFPQVPFDIGESYAGLLNNTPSGDSSLFFWFFPTTNPAGSKDITIWLNGGPGCSSLDGLLMENGPFLWQPGTYEPVRNPYSANNLTNIVYVDQPANTGLSPGPATAQNEIDVSNQFADFWRNFIDTFGMHGYNMYITGESYAGMYVPYIAEGFINRTNTTYYNLKGIQINDPVIGDMSVLTEIPSIPFARYFNNLLNLDKSTLEQLEAMDKQGGYTDYLNAVLTYPPPNPFPDIPEYYGGAYDLIGGAAQVINPCFNVYHITDSCPFPWNQLGFPGAAAGPNNFFNQSAVQKALNVPPTNYDVCFKTVFSDIYGDESVASAFGPLPHVIEATNNTIIGNGWIDYEILMNGTLATIQGMTWNGKQGFQTPPVEDLYVPLTNWFWENEIEWDAGGGILGTAHTERGLTFTTVYTSGHEIPQYAPGAAYRHLEFLLGRIENLQQNGSFTTQ